MSTHIAAVTGESFDRDVLEASRQMPVLVDFWADWCGPCKMLAPVLERVAAGFDGRARIVKLDTEAEQEVARAQGIRSLPTLRLFRHGAAVGEVIGVQPEGAIRALIERHLERPSDRERAEASGLAAAGRPAEAILLLEKVLRDEPGNVAAQVDLIEALVLAGRLDDAEAQRAALPVQALEAPRLEEVDARLFLARAVAGQPAEAALAARVAAAPDDLEAACALAARRFLDGRTGPAIEGWLDALRRGPQFGDGVARKSLLHAFALLGPDAAQVHQYRRRMMALLH